MNIFDIIGPIMIGPSSSHTAGAVRLGRVAGLILGERLKEARIYLHGSFARTGKGHGTHQALVAGLLGFGPDDARIREALVYAASEKLAVDFAPAGLGVKIHPNTARLVLTGISGRTVSVTGSSIGGGNIVVNRINNFRVEISGDYHTLLVTHQDRPGVIAAVTAALAGAGVNIAEMKVSREQKGDRAMMVIETDQAITGETVAALEGTALVHAVAAVVPV